MAAKSVKWLLLALTLGFAVAVHYQFQNPRWLCDQLFLRQAESLLHGKLDLDMRTYDPDVAVYEGKFYSPYPPMPALVFLPFVALLGPEPAIPFVVGLLFVFWSLASVARIATKIGLDQRLRPWILAAFALGTGTVFCLEMSFSAAYNSHLIACAFLFAALAEAMTKGRGFLIGLFVGAALLTRPFAAVGALACAALLEPPAHSTRLKALLKAALAGAPFFFAYFFFTYLQFGSPTASGYQFIPAVARDTQGTFALFDLSYVPRNLYVEFVHGFHWPPGDDGTSLFAASPFLLLAFLAPWSTKSVKWIWASVLLAAFLIACYFFSGILQLNCARYTMDYLPPLFVLLLFALKRHESSRWLPLFPAAVLYAIALNAATAYYTYGFNSGHPT